MDIRGDPSQAYGTMENHGMNIATFLWGYYFTLDKVIKRRGVRKINFIAGKFYYVNIIRNLPAPRSPPATWAGSPASRQGTKKCLRGRTKGTRSDKVLQLKSVFKNEIWNLFLGPEASE